MESKNEDQAAAPAAADDVSAAEISDLREETLADDQGNTDADQADAEKISDPPMRHATDAEIEAMKAKYGRYYDRAVALYAEGLTEPQVDQRIQEEESQTEISAPARFINLGEIVLYGDGTGHVWPAIVTFVYGDSEHTALAARSDTAKVDLQVFKRRFVCEVEGVIEHAETRGGNLDGWVFRK